MTTEPSTAPDPTTPHLGDDFHSRWAAVVVASSAGGIHGLETLLNGLQSTLPVPVLVTQHLARTRETLIETVLAPSTALTVKLAQDGEHPQPGTAYIAPPDRHLCVRADQTLSLTREERVNFTRPAADPLFESAAQAYGPALIGCVLTGTGNDGARGVEAVKARGGTVIAEDPETAAFDGMPQAAVNTGQVDFVLPLEAIAPALTRLVEQATDGSGLAPPGHRSPA